MKKRAAIVIALCVTISSAILICGSLLYINIKGNKTNGPKAQLDYNVVLVELEDENKDDVVCKTLLVRNFTQAHVDGCNKIELINENLKDNGGNLL